jgi:hypothetical protein
VGDEELDVGAWEEVDEDEEDEVPVFPVVPVFPERLDVLSESELPSSEVVVVVDDPGEVGAVVLPTALAPGRSCATTTPMATVAPVAAMTAPRVRIRRRNLALSLSTAVFG